MSFDQYLQLWQADHLAFRIWMLYHGKRRWQTVSGKPPSDGSSIGFEVAGIGRVAPVQAKYSVVEVPACPHVGIERHYLRLWSESLKGLMLGDDRGDRSRLGGLSDDQIIAVYEHLDKGRYRHIAEAIPSRRLVQRCSDVPEVTVQGFVTLLKAAEIGQIKVVYA
jgi:hypothetical protein